MATPTSPLEILPKPEHKSSSAGVAIRLNALRKHRAGPLVFVNSSDLNTDLEKLGNRKMVKKWAMLNRNSRHLRPPSEKVKAQFLSWDSRDTSRASSVCTPDADEDRDLEPSPRSSTAVTVTRKPVIPSTLRTKSAATHRFRDLCIDTDDHAKRLLEYYLRGGRGDIEAPTGRLITDNRLNFPIIAKSPAALCSLIAVLESSPHSPGRSGSKQYRDYYLSMALTHTNDLIKNMDHEPTPTVFFCVSLLMWVSQYVGDQLAISVHFSGMAALMLRHWEIFTATPHFRNGPFFWTFPTNEGNILPTHSEPSIQSRPTSDMISSIDDSDFTYLREDGFISPMLVSFLPHILAMQALTPCKDNSYIISMDTGKDLISYILYNGRTLNFLETHASTPMEHCVCMAATICYYASIFRNTTAGVGWLAGSMQQHVMHMDLSMPMDEYPQVLLWLVLSAGPFAKDMAREWYLDLLVSLRNVMRLRSFEDAALVMEARLIWSRACDGDATRLWDETTEAMRGFSLEPF